MFLAKKIISVLLFPLALCLEIQIVGLILLWFTKKHRPGKILVTSGTLLMILLSTSSISRHLLIPLETIYTPYDINVTSQAPTQDSNIEWIVVLGGGNQFDNFIPVTSRISYPSAIRLLEGIRLYIKYKGSTLILSGGSINESVTNAKTMADIAYALNIPKNDIILEDQSKDTEEEAIYIKSLVGDDRFILVTSASHMPRSMAIFKQQGLNPIPAPTDFQSKSVQSPFYVRFLPSVNGLRMATTSFYEYMGLLWLEIRGRI